MPLKLNVGLTQKVADGTYGSRGTASTSRSKSKSRW